MEVDLREFNKKFNGTYRKPFRVIEIKPFYTCTNKDGSVIYFNTLKEIAQAYATTISAVNRQIVYGNVRFLDVKIKKEEKPYIVKVGDEILAFEKLSDISNNAKTSLTKTQGMINSHIKNKNNKININIDALCDS
jgi:hypothetical protein